jgi:hypothetical protein
MSSELAFDRTSHRANKRIKRSGNVVIKNSTNFNTIINSDLSDASLSNF